MMNSVEAMNILAMNEIWWLEKQIVKPEILQLCQVYGGFLVETQQQAPQLLCTSFGQTILGNVEQPETSKEAHSQIFSIIGKRAAKKDMDQLNIKNI